MTDFKFTDLTEKKSALVRYLGQPAAILLESLSKEVATLSAEDSEAQFKFKIKEQPATAAALQKNPEDPKTVPN